MSAQEQSNAKGPTVKKFFADWRNTALVIAAALIVTLAIICALPKPNPNDRRIARVGEKYITEQQLIDTLKRGDKTQALFNLITNLQTEEYALKKGVIATDQEIDQLIENDRLQAKMQGTDLESALKQERIGMDDYRAMMKTSVLQVKLIVTPEAIKEELAKNAKQYETPALYNFRQFRYDNIEKAKAVIEELKKDPKDGLKTAVMLSMDSDVAEQVRTYAVNGKFADLEEVLGKLKPGETSEPIMLGPADKVGTMCLVFQLVDAKPATPATFDKDALIVGKRMMSKPEYAAKVADMRGAMIAGIDVQVLNPDYEEVSVEYRKMREKNPVIPEAPQMQGGKPTRAPAEGKAPPAPPAGENAPAAPPAPPAAHGPNDGHGH